MPLPRCRCTISQYKPLKTGGFTARRIALALMYNIPDDAVLLELSFLFDFSSPFPSQSLLSIFFTSWIDNSAAFRSALR